MGTAVLDFNAECYQAPRMYLIKSGLEKKELIPRVKYYAGVFPLYI